MNFIKRAFLAVTRRKGKSIIMFVMFFVIANLVLAGFAIKDATRAASESASKDVAESLSQLNADNLKLVLSFDREKAMQEARESQTSSTEQPGRINVTTLPITEAMANKITKLDNIIDFNYVVSGGGMAVDFDPIETTENASTTTDESTTTTENKMPSNVTFGGSTFTMPDVTITGVSSTELSDEFNTGGYELKSGRHIVPEDVGKKVIMIETTLAEENDLKVGNYIEIKTVTTDSTTATTSKFKIVGIFRASSSSTSTISSGPGGGRGFGNLGFMQSYNTIFTDYKSAIPMKYSMNMNSGTTSGIDQAVFFANSLSNIDSIKAAAAKITSIDWDKYVLTASYDQYKNTYETTLAQATKSITGVASISNIVVIAASVIGAIILSLLLMLSVKERMYETGVLLSMGEGKFKVVSQYLVEVIMIAILAFSLSVVSGNFIDQKLGDSLLASQIQTQEEQTAGMQNAVRGNGGMAGRLFESRQNANVEVDEATTITVQVKPEEVAKTAAAGLLIIILGVIFPASTIMRYKPKTILTKAT